LIDYRAGNLTSVRKALAAVGAEVFVPERPDELSAATGIIVPGVGHFGATGALDRAWVDEIVAHVEHQRPLLGICLGMQWLFETSDEAPELRGLGLLSGRCVRLGGGDRSVRLQADQPRIKVPHVGWNTLAVQRESWIADGVPDAAQVYFTHSYVAP